MKTLYAILILLYVIIVQTISQKLCNNGVFKCVSPTSLRICFLDKLVTSEFSCPNETFCNENSPTICSKISNALPGIIFNDELTTTTEEYPEIQCPETGIFNVENTGCTTYLNCSNLEDAIEEECDEVSLFNPETTTCSEDYICPENLDYVKTYEDCSQTENTFVCPKVGSFPLPNTNCQKYIYCKKIYIGLKAIVKFCPKGTLFDPTFGKCVQGHVCYDECVSTTTTEEITTTTTSQEDPPKCTSVGKFPIPNTNCTMYRFCTLLNNDYVHQDRTCPLNSYFDPSKKLCSRVYECFPSVTDEPETTTPDNTANPNDDTTTISNSSPSDNTDSTLTNIVTEEITPDPNDEGTTTASSSEDTDLPSNPVSTVSEETPTTTLNSIITDETPEDTEITDGNSSEVTDLPSTPISTVSEETTTTTLNSIITDETPEDTEITEGNSSEVTDLPSTPISTVSEETPTTTLDSIITDNTPENTEITEGNSSEATDLPSTPISTVSEETTTTTLNSIITDETPENTEITEGNSSEGTDLPSTPISTVSEEISTTTLNSIITDETPKDTEITEGNSSEVTDLPSTPISTVSEETTTTTLNSIITDETPEDTEITEGNSSEVTDLPSTPISTVSEETPTTTLNSIITDETPGDTEITEGNSSEVTDLPNTPISTVSEETPTTTLNSIITDETPEDSSNTEITEGTSSEVTTTLKPDDGTDNCVITEDDSSIPTDGSPITPEVTETSSSLEDTETPSTPTNTVTDETTPNTNDDEITTTTLNSISTEETITPNDDETTTPAIDCRSQGRLPILNTNCKMYYQCTLTTNGYTYKTYECSKGTLFDPYKKQCLQSYICPETILTTSTQFPDIDDSDEEIDLLNCTESGRVPVPHTDCLYYGQCILTTGGFIQTIYECPSGTLFDAERKICSDSYVCPETTDSGEITTISSELTTESPVPFCTQHGKFPVLNTKCKNYLSCILTTNGFISNEYACSGDLLFDPVLKKCSSRYTCPEEQSYIPLIHETYPDSSNCVENGKFPVIQSMCSQYILCSLTQNGFISKVYTCPANTYFNPETKKCSHTYSCPEIEPEPEIIPECHETGKFSIENSECSKYILCTLTSTGFRSKIYSCPIDSYFNPEAKRCQKDYICPEITDLETTTELDMITTTELDVITTTEDTSSEEQTTECINVLKDSPVCVKQGKFPIPGKNCKEYILCTLTSSGFVSKIYECPVNSNFDPDRKKCTITYNCQEKICETKIAKLKKPKITKCKYSGKFSIKGTNCQKFKLCVWTNQGYTKTVYDCPKGTYFNPRLQQCSSNYFCSEGINYNCTTVGLFKDHTDLTCEYYISCKVQGDGTVRGERKICPVNLYFDPVRQRCSSQYFCKIKRTSRMMEAAPKFLVNGQCTTIGRYAIPGTNCKSYMYCADNGAGTLKGTVFTCPTTSVFNQSIQKCTATYICPDSVCRFPGLTDNPNSKDCTSYIQCEDVYDQNGLIVGSTGRVVYCPVGQKYNPIMQCCSWTYVCPK